MVWLLPTPLTPPASLLRSPLTPSNLYPGYPQRAGAALPSTAEFCGETKGPEAAAPAPGGQDGTAGPREGIPFSQHRQWPGLPPACPATLDSLRATRRWDGKGQVDPGAVQAEGATSRERHPPLGLQSWWGYCLVRWSLHGLPLLKIPAHRPHSTASFALTSHPPTSPLLPSSPPSHQPSHSYGAVLTNTIATGP